MAFAEFRLDPEKHPLTTPTAVAQAALRTPAMRWIRASTPVFVGGFGNPPHRAWAFVQRYWWAVIIVLGGTTGIILTILNYAPTGTASVAAIIATALGSLGVSWKTIAATLGKVAALAEKPLWNAEVLEAITLATFIPPVQMNSRAKTSLRRKSMEPLALPAPPGDAAELQQPPPAAPVPAAGEA